MTSLWASTGGIDLERSANRMSKDFSTYLGTKGWMLQHDGRVAELLNETIFALNGYEVN
jgi:hypothetical protein